MAPETTFFHPARSQAIIPTYGGHMLSWLAADGIECLYPPDFLEVESGRALRGGVPMCFPQFANRGSLMKQVFARLLSLQVVLQEERNIVLASKGDKYNRSVGNYGLRLDQHIHLAENALCI